MSYVVTAPVAKVEVGPVDLFLRKGDILPDEASKGQVEHLISMGLVESVSTEKATEPRTRATK